MTTLIDTGEFAVPLVRVVSPAPEAEARSPGVTGAFVGAAAGMLALGLVHGIDPRGLSVVIDHAASVRAVSFAAAMTLAYVTAGTVGAVTGAAFGHVTRFLRKWPALAVWGVVFFTSLALLLVGATSAYHGGVRHDLAGPIIAGGALYGFLLSFSLPIRRRH